MKLRFNPYSLVFTGCLLVAAVVYLTGPMTFGEYIVIIGLLVVANLAGHQQAVDSIDRQIDTTTADPIKLTDEELKEVQEHAKRVMEIHKKAVDRDKT